MLFFFFFNILDFPLLARLFLSFLVVLFGVIAVAGHIAISAP